MAKDRQISKVQAENIKQEVMQILDRLVWLFLDNDEALSAQGLIVVYYLLFRKAVSQNEEHLISRDRLIDFRDALVGNRKKAEKDIENSIFDYLDFDRLNQQGTNDASSIRERTRTISEYLDLGDPQVIITFSSRK